MKEERDLQKECDEKNQSSEEYRQAHYGEGSSRRTYHWEVVGNNVVLVED